VRLLGNPETSFGIPSGHALNAVTVWGTMAYHIKRQWAWIAAGLLILLIGLSRIYLGVHFPTDVVVGWGIGLALLALIIGLEKPVTRWFGGLSRLVQVGLLLVFSLLLIAVASGVMATAEGRFPVPDAWASTAALSAPEEPLAPYSLEGTITSAATLFGLFTGLLYFNDGGPLDARGPWMKRAARYVAGLIGVLILWRGLGIVFALLADDETLFSYALRYLRYALVGGWISGLGPWVFVKLKIGERIGTE